MDLPTPASSFEYAFVDPEPNVRVPVSGIAFVRNPADGSFV
jgi:hypothetical protein